MEEVLRAKILDLLASQYLMTLATIRPDGYPQATTVNYINDDLTVYFVTDAASQKVGNIALNNKVSIAITSQTEDFYKLSGLSMSGIATRILDEEAAQIVLRLFRRLPQSKRYVPQDPGSLAVYAITPVAIALVEYASGLGKRFLVEL